MLVFAIGNPSRGDDALGPCLIEALERRPLPDVELMSDFQLQVEHALDLLGRQVVVFVDAAASGPEPFAFLPVAARQEASFTSHALSPQALLHTYARLYGPPPAAYLLAIRGHDFGLGAKLSPSARANLAAAEAYLRQWLASFVRAHVSPV